MLSTTQMFSEKDLAFIQNRGSNLNTVETQLDNFKQGFPFMSLVKAATVGDGILRLDIDQKSQYAELYAAKMPGLSTLKFVPASGAASRMFKALFAAMNDAPTGDLAGIQESHAAAHKFFANNEAFAFSKSLEQAYGKSVAEGIENEDYAGILKSLLTEEGLNYGNLPKGLLEFHQYESATRTPLEEHLVEGIHYCQAEDGAVNLHLTVSPDHKEKFAAKVEEVKGKLEETFQVKFSISFSEQKASTDTIAVDLENQPFRLDNGNILFRPGGHGALIENLNELQADIVFIKNIDNVVPDALKAETYAYKKALAGVLLALQEKIFGYIAAIDNQAADLAEVEQFLAKELCVLVSADYKDLSEADKWQYLRNKLNRPIRVCGMVKNEGEPGGGPFWTTNADGSVSLQVVESAQIDKGNESQMAMVQGATHFNPVDLICAPNDYQGNKFDLLKYRDPQTGFIASKSKDGRELKAQELPGLWNGAMADWNTIFVEVPIITFNPVKTVNDLLRKEHQG